MRLKSIIHATLALAAAGALCEPAAAQLLPSSPARSGDAADEQFTVGDIRIEGLQRRIRRRTIAKRVERAAVTVFVPALVPRLRAVTRGRKEKEVRRGRKDARPADLRVEQPACGQCDVAHDLSFDPHSRAARQQPVEWIAFQQLRRDLRRLAICRRINN